MNRRRRWWFGFAAAAWFAAGDFGMAQSPEGSSRFARLDDARVHYTDYGKGDFALVLVHGWNCDESVWKNQAPTLARTTRVITVDLPGHGQSDKPPIAYTMDLHARALESVLQDASVQAAVLVGHSNGTPVIRQFYRRYPEKVKGLVIVDGALRPYGDAAMIEKFIAPLRSDYRETVERFVDGMTKPMKNAADAEQIKTMMRSSPQEVAVSEMEGLLDPALWAPDPINVPVLMILARQPVWTSEYEEFVRGMIPKLDYQLWDAVSHFVMMDKPNEFNDAVLAFFAKNHLAAQ